ncbi:putative endoplasmic reticulum protein [Filobasidium floriforme]|uniref:putative endoplasmic reticulum protein n=1 Tax=Filobasidium floriforme TaxID=5210 RepID=UPI001E8E5F47|nr:putative endoplasmic reticulum protein [Filobasidium floriforme]KAH8083508.1 putative endoplasmic reticulum protein [Filobasidium floriforme]
MTLLHLLSYVGSVVAFLFVTLSLASGLLWLAELIEEHSKTAKAIGMRTVYGIMAVHVLLFIFDHLPFTLIAFSLAAHAVYLTNFTPQWPFISLTSPRFLLSCVMVVADHFLWFFHFAEKAQEAKAKRQPRYRYGAKATTTKGSEDAPSFMDVAAFFAICVWLVPLFLFLSLSANDNVLPSQDTIPGTPSSIPGQLDLGTPKEFPHPTSKSFTYTVPRTSLVKSILAPLLSLLPRIGTRTKRNDEGIIAPRTPIRGSPMPSPIIQPQGYSPWGAVPDSLGLGGSSNTSTLTPGGGGMNAPPPRRTASEVNVSGSTGSSVMPRRSVSPGGVSMSLSPDHSASLASHSSHYGNSNVNANGIGNSNGNGMTTTYMSEEPGSMSTGRSVSPGPVMMMAGSNPSGAGLTARRAGRKDD